MNCQNCGEQIPKEWIDVINNLHSLGEQITFTVKCKECGEPVMDDNVLQLLGGLTSIMSKEGTAQDVMDWLLVTYKMARVKEDEKGGFTARIIGRSDNHEEDKQKRLAEFLARADASPTLVGKTKNDLINENKNMSAGTEVTMDNNGMIDDNGVIDFAGDQYKDPAMSHIDISDYEDPTMMRLPENEKMPPALRALLEKNIDRQNQARDNITSGIRVNKNGFTRG